MRGAGASLASSDVGDGFAREVRDRGRDSLAERVGVGRVDGADRDAVGLEPVAEADLDAWEQMLATNLIGTTRVTKALLPALTAAGGAIIFVTSTAADWGYEGGAGYCAAKAGERAVVEALRLELFDQPVRIMEICPGMVRTDEFALTRFAGDKEKAGELLLSTSRKLDKAASKGVIHKNQAANKKSALALALNKL